VGKAWASFDVLPEADHNSLEGIINPGDFISKTMVLFLRAGSIYPANRMRLDLTRKTMMLEGVNTDFIDAQGETRLAQQWTSLHHGDYVAYYLAMAYEVDPSPVMTIESFKREMQSAAAGSV
jgi:glucose/mannose-6-phosphate isomerase